LFTLDIPLLAINTILIQLSHSISYSIYIYPIIFSYIYILLYYTNIYYPWPIPLLYSIHSELVNFPELIHQLTASPLPGSSATECRCSPCLENSSRTRSQKIREIPRGNPWSIYGKSTKKWRIFFAGDLRWFFHVFGKKLKD
jgi:hypothetical protein